MAFEAKRFRPQYVFGIRNGLNLGDPFCGFKRIHMETPHWTSKHVDTVSRPKPNPQI